MGVRLPFLERGEDGRAERGGVMLGLGKVIWGLMRGMRGGSRWRWMLGRCRSIGMYKMDEDGENWYGLLVKIDKVREKQSEKEEQRREKNYEGRTPPLSVIAGLFYL